MDHININYYTVFGKSLEKFKFRSEIESVPTENLTCSAFAPIIFFFNSLNLF